MRIELKSIPQELAEADALIVPAFEKDAPRTPAATLAGGWLERLYESGEFTGKALETALLHNPPGLAAKRLVAAGCGAPAKFDAAEMRKAVAAAVRFVRGKAARTIAAVVDGADPEMAAAAVEGALLGDYEPDVHKTGDRKESKRVDGFSVVGAASLAPAVERARILAESQNFARDLVNEPANLLTPSVLAARARALAAETGLACEVLDEAKMRELGMGSLLGVAQGSAEPPALIVLRYTPEGEAKEGHLGLVGKGVTFDTGGISIKPSDGMEKMKYDMAGGAAVLGAMRAIARLQPAVRVTAFVPAVENMPGSRAQRPGDIVKSMSGKTVEVLNTDAEGRLILIDAITYAKQQGCTHLVDAATLTGAIVVALGHIHVGLFSNNEEFQAKVLRAAKAEGEKMWPMPLDDEYKDYLKSPFADLPNIGGRYGGAVTAAMFLKEWAEDTPWVHLDIAGTAWLDEGKPYAAKGPSGVGVRTFVRLAAEW